MTGKEELNASCSQNHSGTDVLASGVSLIASKLLILVEEKTVKKMVFVTKRE